MQVLAADCKGLGLHQRTLDEEHEIERVSRAPIWPLGGQSLDQRPRSCGIVYQTARELAAWEMPITDCSRQQSERGAQAREMQAERMEDWRRRMDACEKRGWRLS